MTKTPQSISDHSYYHARPTYRLEAFHVLDARVDYTRGEGRQ
jgi:hypothetical protein